MSAENHIEEIRKETRTAISGKDPLPGNGEEFVSPNGQYTIEQTFYHDAFPTKIEVFDREKNRVSSFLIDDDRFFHQWILTDDMEYLLFAENLCGGNSVLNLRTGEIHGYSDGMDGFISAIYYPSPDLRHLAIVGCYWACPYEVQLFDISNIESLPWPMILQTDLEGSQGDVVWVDNNTFSISKPRGETSESLRHVTVPNGGTQT